MKGPVSIIREPDDKIAKTRVSLGEPRAGLGPRDGMYLVFRGDPADVVSLLRDALALAEQELPAGRYQDRRGRGQG